MKVTINNIENDLFDLDTEYREALAELNYLSSSPLQLYYGTIDQQRELKRVYETPLKSKEIKEIIIYVSNKMKHDFQFGSFSRIVSKYLDIANQMEKNNKLKER